MRWATMPSTPAVAKGGRYGQPAHPQHRDAMWGNEAPSHMARMAAPALVGRAGLEPETQGHEALLNRPFTLNATTSTNVGTVPTGLCAVGRESPS